MDWREWQAIELSVQRMLAWLVPLWLGGTIAAAGDPSLSGAGFSERLLVEPFSDGNVGLKFEFITIGGKEHEDGHEHLPKPLLHLVSAFSVDALNVTLTHGRFRPSVWGHALAAPLAPHGGAVAAWLRDDRASVDNTDKRWAALLETLAGLLCASLNQVGAQQTSQPQWIFRPPSRAEGLRLRYGTLPRENVCTENLTPWGKLLPCRTQAGIARLLHPIRLLDAHYHSLQLSIAAERDAAGALRGYRLVQSLTAVLTPPAQPWTLAALLGEAEGQLPAGCPVAARSELVVLTQQQADKEGGEWLDSRVSSGRPWDVRTSASLTWHANAMLPLPDVTFLSPPPPLPETARRVPVLTRFFGGRGQQSGVAHVAIANTQSTAPLSFAFYDALPWFLRIYFSTLVVRHNGKPVWPVSSSSAPADGLGLRLRFLPAEYKGRPAEIELDATLQPGDELTIDYEFDKAFLPIGDFPPDVSRGFDIPSAALLNHETGDIIYTDGALILLPTPDFSMPFNVIAFTSTIMAFFLGSLFNMTFSSDAEVMRRSQANATNRFAAKFRRCRRRRAAAES